ncbi:MAG TPA: heme-binding protein [Candidatus Polarisedimenticolaceae bacterium]|nr:heme-binding protein [Candidatus Polarisedimenticolaceae bacterium]
MRHTLLSVVAISIALATAPPGAQAAGTEARRFLTLEGAKSVVAAAAAEAKRNGAGGAIAVVDEGGHLLCLERLDGTFPAAATVAVEKARTAAIFRRPTSDFENAIKNGRTSLVAVGAMTPLQGGIPLMADGQVVGAIGVSGAASAQQDDDIARAAASSFK